MDSGSVVVLFVVILIAVATVATVLIVQSKRRKEAARVEALSPVERERHDAEIEYETAVKTAEKNHASELKAREKRLKAAEKALVAANNIGTRKIASYRGKDGAVALTELAITTPQGTFGLDRSVTATVDTAGNLATSSRTTLTRVAAGGLLFGPVGAIVGGVARKNKVHDNRELYLMLEGEGFAGLITCNPDDGQKVRQFAASVRQASINFGETVARRQHEIAAMSQALEAERAATAAVNGTAAALESARTNTTRLNAAIHAIEAGGSPLQIEP